MLLNNEPLLLQYILVNLSLLFDFSNESVYHGSNIIVGGIVDGWLLFDEIS